MNTPNAEHPKGSYIIDKAGISFIVLEVFPSHTFNNTISFLVVTAQIPSDILIAMGNTIFVKAST